SDKPFYIKGTLIDLYNPQLPIFHSKKIKPGEQGLFLDIDRVQDKKKPQILAAASRAYNEKRTAHSYSYIAKSPIHTTNISRILLPEKPKILLINGEKQLNLNQWDPHSMTYLLKFENSPDGVSVMFKW